MKLQCKDVNDGCYTKSVYNMQIGESGIVVESYYVKEWIGKVVVKAGPDTLFDLTEGDCYWNEFNSSGYNIGNMKVKLFPKGSKLTLEVC